MTTPKYGLGTSDSGIVLLREQIFENIRRVEQGLAPAGVIRDPNYPMIDTKLEEGQQYMRNSGTPRLNYRPAALRS